MSYKKYSVIIYVLFILLSDCSKKSRVEEPVLGPFSIRNKKIGSQNEDCLKPSFACSGGFYGTSYDFGPHTFHYVKETLRKKDEHVDYALVSEIIKSNLKKYHDKNEFILVQIAMNTGVDVEILKECFDSRGHLKTTEGPYSHFLKAYQKAFEANLVDFVVVGEEVIPGHTLLMDVIKAIAHDLHERYHVKVGLWPSPPIGPVELRVEAHLSDFFIYDFYDFIYASHESKQVHPDPLWDHLHPQWNAFIQFEDIGKDWFLVLSVTPSVSAMKNLLSQIELANNHNVPILFFGVTPKNTFQGYDTYVEEDFVPYQHIAASLFDLQNVLRLAKKGTAPLLSSNFKLGEPKKITLRSHLFHTSFNENNSKGYITLLNAHSYPSHLDTSLPLKITESDNSMLIIQMYAKKKFVPTDIKIQIDKDTPNCNLEATVSETGIPTNTWYKLVKQDGEEGSDKTIEHFKVDANRSFQMFRLRLNPLTTPCMIHSIDVYGSVPSK